MVCLSVCNDHEPSKNSWTAQDAIWVVDSGGPKKLYIRWGSRSPLGRGTFEGMTSVFSHMVLSTIPSGPDIGISLHAVNQHSDWLATEAAECRINFSQWKLPVMRPVIKVHWPLVYACDIWTPCDYWSGTITGWMPCVTHTNNVKVLNACNIPFSTLLYWNVFWTNT